MTLVKICGLSTAETLDAAIESGADFVGFVFYPSSPRFVTPPVAGNLTARVPERVKTVGLFVDPQDEEIGQAMAAARLDMIQLHGNETPQRVQAVRKTFGRPVMKAIRVSSAEDISVARAYEATADWLLFDAKPDGAKLPGGTGRSFDWSLLQTFKSEKPWMLAGGLHAGNIGQALGILKPDAIDLSSGVERAPGVKNAALIREFMDVFARTKKAGT